VITSETLQARFDAAAMSGVQKVAVALTCALSALDGYDVLSMTFAAPAITLAWGVGKAALGVVLSSGLVGMALGSFLLAPLADFIGRKRMILISLILMGFGALLSGFATSLPQLATWRVVTGLGIGACIAVINPISAEFANGRWRPFSVALMAVGYPAGGLIGGLLASMLLRSYGWPAVFFAGFMAAVIFVPIVALLLPESLAFLANDHRPGNLNRLNALLKRCGQPFMETMPPRAAAASRGYAVIFKPAEIGITVRMALVNMLTAAAVYYVFSWLPQMVVDAGFNPSKASLVASMLNLVGIGSGLIIGVLARFGGLRLWTVAMIIGFGVTTGAFGATPSSFALLLLVAGICGFFLFAAVAGYYGLLASSFGDEARASGVGFVIGTGRISSAIAPSLAGWLFASGLGRAEVSAAFGGCAVLAGIILAFHRTKLVARAR
jgi:MFS transporter, AAHS family, 4-hydroxybenzoate transporter